MDWIIPGTVLTGDRQNVAATQTQLDAMFLAGGIVRSQVAALTGLEPHMVQNWVKRGFLSHPVDKRYTQRQLSRILIINMLKNALPLERICALLTYINGQLDDESDDWIDDTRLYFAFLRVAACYDTLTRDPEQLKARLTESLGEYAEPAPGAKDRVIQVLEIMLTAWAASNLCREAEEKLNRLGI